MVPHVLKFVSVDKLSRFEMWPNRYKLPEYAIERFCIAALRGFTQNEMSLAPLPIVRRRYEFYEQYADETNGNVVWEYRETI